jgi:hypothetical protein
MFSAKSVPYLVSFAVLFILLSPGVLLTVPNPNGSTWYDVVTVGTVSTQVLVHSVVFALVLVIVKKILRALLGRRRNLRASTVSSGVSTASSAAASTVSKAASTVSKAVSTVAKKL